MFAKSARPPLKMVLGLLSKMHSPTKLSAFLAGVPTGLAVALLNNRGNGDENSHLLSETQASLIFVIYALSSVVVFALGLDCIKKRMKYPVSKLLTEPRVYMNYHLGVFGNDVLQMLIYFFGSIVGGVIIGTQT